MGHKYLVAAYIVTWVIQLGYLLFILLKWKSQRNSTHSGEPKSR